MPVSNLQLSFLRRESLATWRETTLDLRANLKTKRLITQKKRQHYKIDKSVMYLNQTPFWRMVKQLSDQHGRGFL